MLVGSIARRYAKALLEIGIDHKNYDLLGKELDRVAAAIDGSAELRHALENPTFPLSQRRAVIEDVLRRLAVSPTMRNFVMLLLDRGRVASVGSIAREYRKLVDEQAGRVRAIVTSARPLPAMLEGRLKAALEKRTGKQVILEKREDPALLGGIVTQIGDLVFDGSVRSQLAAVREKLLSE